MNSSPVGCSVYTLSLGSICALTSAALVGIAFSTDNWRHISVDRDDIQRQTGPNDVLNVSWALKEDHRYFDRVQGMFRMCFPYEDRPPLNSGLLYLNPIEEWCKNIDYYVRLLDLPFVPARLTRHGEIWFHVARSSIAAFALYFMLVGIGCVTGLLGCWRASGDHLISTALLFLLGSLSGTAGMGLWHWAQFYEIEKVYDERLNFYLSWPEHLRAATSFTLGWSYILCWLGLGLALLSSTLFSAAATCIKQELKGIEHREMLIKMNLAYNSNSILRQPNGMVSTPMSRRSSLSLPPCSSYLSAGFPVSHDLRSIQYNNVVKELEDGKL